MAKKTLQGPFCHCCLFLFGTVTLMDSEVVVKDFSLSCNAAKFHSLQCLLCCLDTQD